MVVVLFAVSVLTFLIFNVIPNGDPAVRMAGKSPTDTQVEAIRAEWGFDESLPVQYVNDDGEGASAAASISYFTQLNVQRGDPQGLAADAVARGRRGDPLDGHRHRARTVAARCGRDESPTGCSPSSRSSGISMPVFWLGALMSHYLGFKLGWFPNGGYVPFTESPLDWAYHLILPCTALSILFIGFYSRVLRSNVLDTMSEDFVRTARAKGLSERAGRSCATCCATR